MIAAGKKNPWTVVKSVFDWYRTCALYRRPTLLCADRRQTLTVSASHYPLEERRLLRKLDLTILIFGSLSCKL
jgi:hypothetical protein